MKSFKYTINGNVYKVHINSVEEDIAEVEVNGTPYSVKMEKPAKKQMVALKRPAQAPTTASGEPVVSRPAGGAAGAVSLSAARCHPERRLQGWRYSEERPEALGIGGYEDGEHHPG